ncbi:superoxide dismutase [candidate division KSB1 bacterium]|nr:superoxide dismutase [candidate division KSB1 bacterium]RQW07938.1 MAG: superoxide dismutase [candidate division KSB1 bacterium]
MNTKKYLFLFAAMFTIGFSTVAFAHCEIPCGIYTDKMRFEMWEEQIATVEKSMKQIVELSKAGEKNYNQIVRWVVNKDEHADDIREIAVQYFLAQRIVPVADPTDQAAVEKYNKSLEVLHHIIVHAMKAKQTTDLQHVDKLRELVKQFYKLYFNEEMQEHLEEHHH